VSASIIGREYISGQNLGKDLPMLLSRIPSLVASSDAGHGIGYSTFRIRGTDMNRINITMDGVPLNDAESHGVWFVNMPDFATSIENIQVQRGVGTSGNGAAAFGASVNFLSKRTDPEAYGEINSSFGSYNTFRNSIQVGSGTIKDKFNVQIRLSDIKTDGYIERAGSDLSAAQISSSWVSGKDLLKFNLLTGKEKTYQAWDGVPYELLSINRRYNGMGKYTDESGITRYYDNETDNYQQDHYHLHYTRRLKQNMHLNTSLHYTHGEGYYEQYKENQDFAGYGLDYPFVNGSLITETDLIRQ
jgi:iron complex outermembrane receptor protein